VSGIDLRQDAEGKTFLRIARQPRPGATADKDLLARWDDMVNRKGNFTGQPDHDAALKEFWIRTVAPPAEAAGASPGVLYEVTYDTDMAKLPRDLEQVRLLLAQAVRISEPRP
jgi:hypothetical protein